jgi:hypothetical protein
MAWPVLLDSVTLSWPCAPGTPLRLARPLSRPVSRAPREPCRALAALRTVAMPVHDMWSTPGPKYSTMAPVPPLTVRMPAT